MSLFKDIRIIGLDPGRPPRVRKETYIDLYYQLSEDAPVEWCDDFESLGRRISPVAKVDKSQRSFINTYVNDMDVIPTHFLQVKQAVADCNARFREKLRQRDEAAALSNARLREQGGAQYKLNEIIESLEFDS